MQLEHEFALPVPPDRAWAALLDLQRVAPCMPGATLDHVDGDSFTGRVTLKVGPLRLSYRGDGQIREKDEAARRLVLVATGQEAKGSGTAEATVTAALEGAGQGTRVRLRTDLALTGRAAQFGRGLVAEVSGTLLNQFAERLSYELQSANGAGPRLAPAPAAVGPGSPAPAAEHAPRHTAGAPPADAENALDVLSLARAAVGGRGLVLAAGAAAVLAAFLLGRRSRRAPAQPWPAIVLIESGRG